MFDPSNYHPETPEFILNIFRAADDCAVDEEWGDDLADAINITGSFIEMIRASGEDPDVIRVMEDAHEGMAYCWNAEGDIDGFIGELEKVYNIAMEA